MRPFKDHTLKEYLDSLSAKEPVPGGGSAAALAGALGAGLISMVTQYSLPKLQSKSDRAQAKEILKKSEKLRRRLLVLVDLDSKAYLRLRETKNAKPAVRQAALKTAREIPLEICRLSYEAVELTPFLVAKGSRYLISDVKAALEMLFAAYTASLAMVETNQ